MTVAVPTFAGSKGNNTSEQQKRFVVHNPNHTQVLARKSIRAHKGLENAARHSHVIMGDDPKDDSDEPIGPPTSVIRPGLYTSIYQGDNKSKSEIQ